MIVARIASWTAVALSGLGLIVAVNGGDPFLAGAAVSSLFVAALFWSLAEIGDRLKPDMTAKPTSSSSDDMEQARGITNLEPLVTSNASLADLDRKLAAARSK